MKKKWQNCKDMVTYFDVFDFFVSYFEIFAIFSIHIFLFFVFFPRVRPVQHTVRVRNRVIFIYIYKIITNQLRFFYQHLFRFFRPRLCYPSLGNENGKQPKFTLSIPHISPRMMYSLQLTLPSRFLLLNFWPCIASGLQLHYTVLQTVGCEPWPIPRLHPCWTAAMLWRCCRHTSTGVAGAFSQWK